MEQYNCANHVIQYLKHSLKYIITQISYKVMLFQLTANSKLQFPFIKNN